MCAAETCFYFLTTISAGGSHLSIMFKLHPKQYWIFGTDTDSMEYGKNYNIDILANNDI